MRLVPLGFSIPGGLHDYGESGLRPGANESPSGARRFRLPHIAFSMQFRGQSTRLSPGVLVARATAPSSALVTLIDTEGVHGHLEPRDGEEAHLECRLTFEEDGRFEDVGTISFGSGNALRFLSTGAGTLTATHDPGLRHGAAAFHVDGGSGVFAGATGRIVSNFLLSDTGDFTDRQLGVVFPRKTHPLGPAGGQDPPTRRRQS